ncbi:protein XRP2-like isoform X2 [Paramacrobiotus metropolitanus]|uniref:protein XRP2-like isoform X2 n=1 Tax=Paramacrobiotus metropolitanus TaxID=2943436 RepID=UPI00244611F8|nr:protein XRP2-like isoform X2 [Paramacrobiotus metropolitanus]
MSRPGIPGVRRWRSYINGPSTCASATSSTVALPGQNGSRRQSGDPALKVYSWNNRPKVNPEDYQFIAKENETLVKQPQAINGQQFIIERCRNCNIFLFDWCDTVTILDCTGCAIFVGPCKGSIFLRHCVDCTILVICQQFRTRDCRRLAAYLCCCTQPIIENTVGAKFACLQISYNGLEDQLKAAKLSPFNNNWSQVHDFTPNTDDILSSHNFSLIHDTLATAKVGLSDPESIGDVDLKANFDPCVSVIPYTMGVAPTNALHEDGEHCLVVIFAADYPQVSAVAFTKEIQNFHPSLILINSREISLSATDLQRILKTGVYADACKKGPVTILHYFGAEAIKICHKVSGSTVNQGSKQSAYVSNSKEFVQSQIENLWNLADMKMN